MMPPKLGIIAGGGDLPREIIAECQRLGRDYFVVALKGHADASTVSDSPHEWVRLGAAGQTVKLLHREIIAEVVLAGSVKRPSLFQLRPDFWAIKFFARTGVANKGDNGLLQAIVTSLETQEGFRVVGVHSVLPSLLARVGCVSRQVPDRAAISDIELGWAAALSLGAADLGQAVVARNGCVVARETASGTAAMLETVTPDKGGIPVGVLVKVSKPGQERRADLPAIGPDTISQVVNAGLAGVAIEADQSLILNRKETIAAANEAGVFIDVRVGIGT